MYHRILIPVKDQHVHRFLWGDMEIGRDPDVYIETVLTFGDKPAPAMEQIALRKTTNELQGRWMNGPQFLHLPEDQWPIQQTPPPSMEDMGRRQIHVLTAVTAQKAKSVIDPSTFTSWRKLIRVTARIRRLAEKIRLRKFGQHQREGPLLPKSLQK